MGKTKTAFIGDTKESNKAKKGKDQQPARVHVSGQKGGERVKMIEADPVISAAVQNSGEQPKSAHHKTKTRSKRYLAAKKSIDRNKLYSIAESVKLAKENSLSSFDGTLELHLVIKKTGFSTQVSLPHAAGKTKKVELADESTIEKLKAGKVDFDVLLTTPEMMPRLVPFARILGPKGLMPNPKNGTIIKDKKDAEKFNVSKTTLKTEKKAPVLHTVVGKVSSKDSEVVENIEAIFEAVNKNQILKAYISPTMGPSVKISAN